MPPLLAGIMRRISEETTFEYNSVYLNKYRDGNDSIGHHADNDPQMTQASQIASVSLGATRKFNIKNNITKSLTSVYLEAGDLLVMSWQDQREYTHEIPKTKKPVGPRINLTYRLFDY